MSRRILTHCRALSNETTDDRRQTTDGRRLTPDIW